jgi:hypothetical protein
MFKIQDGRTKFYQWDIDRKLVIDDESITQVHFCNKTDSCSLVCEAYTENGVRLVNVPNILLQTDWRINVYAYDGNYTKHSAVYYVVARTKPANYVYTETEVLNYAALDERIAALEKGGGGGATADLSNYYTKPEVEQYVNSAIGNIDIPEVDLTGYATEQYVETAITNTLGVIENGYY